MAAATAIATRKLTKRYGDTTAVDELDLTVKQGEIFGLLGPNGAGKTTSILMLLGMTEPTSGTVSVLGLDPRFDALAIKQSVGYLPDSVGFYDTLTGRQNLNYSARLNRVPRTATEERVRDLINAVGLTPDEADRKVKTYSRGMKQRLGIADALVKDPQIIILDEPTAAIDPIGVTDILTLITDLRDERGITVLLSSHLLQQVDQICDRMAIFSGGSAVGIGSVTELARKSRNYVVDIGLDDTKRSDDPAAVFETIGSVQLVESVGPQRWRITARRNIRAKLTAQIAESRWTLTHLNERSSDLESIYASYWSDRDHR